MLIDSDWCSLMLIDLLLDEIDESGWKWKMMMMTMTPESYTRPFYVDFCAGRSSRNWPFKGQIWILRGDNYIRFNIPQYSIDILHLWQQECQYAKYKAKAKMLMRFWKFQSINCGSEFAKMFECFPLFAGPDQLQLWRCRWEPLRDIEVMGSIDLVHN